MRLTLRLASSHSSPLPPSRFLGPDAGQVRLAQIEFALDPPPRIILELAVAVGRVDMLPLGRNQLRSSSSRLAHQRRVRLVAIAAMFHMAQALAVRLPHRRQNLFAQLALPGQFLEPHQRSP